MNIRFAPGQIRFRIDRLELETLLGGRALVMRVDLPGQHAFTASVNPDRLGTWRLDSDPTGMWLVVPRRALAAFEDGVPTADGLTHRFELATGGELELTLEVDVRG
jgi:hypothetical protein